MQSFDWKTYISNYGDLRNAGIDTEEKALEHWNNAGKHENRIYHKSNINDTFDWIYYIDYYKDLRDAGIDTEEKALEHWNTFGYFEGRQCNDDKFNYKIYLNNYKDLRDAGIDTEEKALEHWNIAGKFEGRKCYDYDETYFTQHSKYLKNNTTLNLTNIVYCNSDFTDDYILDKNVNYTNNFGVSRFNPELIDVKTINLLHNFILVIDFPNYGGGTTAFLNILTTHYKKHKTFLIARCYNDKVIFTVNDDHELDYKFNVDDANDFITNNSSKIEKIFINHSLNHSILFLKNLFKLDKKISMMTHDFYSICSECNPVIHKINCSYHNSNKININEYDMVITQNDKNLLIMDSHITNKNKHVVITDLPDYRCADKLIETQNNNIVIGIFGAITMIKGQNIVKHIIEYYSNTTVKVIVFGMINIDYFTDQYVYSNIDELNNLLITHKPNVLIETSICPETYSFTLSLKMITNLPILFFKKTGNFVVEDRLRKYNKAYGFETINELDVLVHKYKQNYFYTILPKIYFNSFWDDYFKNINKNNMDNANSIYKNNINIYPIYFPQFHVMIENSINFYDGFTDITNLELLTQHVNADIPNLHALGLKNIRDYDLQNIDIIQKQINIISQYGIHGFAVYYYWFSQNTITNNNMVMEKVIDAFFKYDLNMHERKIFFIWANESWTKNPAFGSGTHKIENTYDIQNISLNAENLMRYFTHKNYLKIDNKPVFLIYHSWFMTQSDIDNFYVVLNDMCIKYFFNGVHLVINSMNCTYENHKQFYLNFNYKRTTSTYIGNDNQIYLDYTKYVSNDLNLISNTNIINTLVFDFDNRARLFKPNHMHSSTICKNNSEFNKIRFIDAITKKYDKPKTSDVENILLINAWNEWSENMTIEPSEKHGFYYLNLINEYLSV